MPDGQRAGLILGSLTVLLSLLALFVWIPQDVGSGMFETMRRRVFIGDAFAPTVAASFILFSGALIILESLRQGSAGTLTSHNVRFIVILALTVIVTLLMFRWLGPLTIELFSHSEYRLLRTTRPWNFLSFMTGGIFLITAFMTFMDRRFSWQAVSTGLIVTIILAFLIDIPFDSLLLPPNGDV